MHELKLALQFIIVKELEIILDKISNDYNIPIENLHKYIINDCSTNTPTNTKNPTNIEHSTDICMALTKTNSICGNKLKGGVFCGKHTKPT